jgi:hypothetical protein
MAATKLEKLCKRSHIRLSFEFEGVRKDGDWEHRAYLVRLSRRPSYSVGPFYYRQGIGISEGPTAASVLASLLLDAQCGSLTFEGFCADMGLSEDSRKAYATWEACQRTASMMAHFLPGAALRAELEEAAA